MNHNLIGKVISPEELSTIYPDGEFYRLTNYKECHNGLQYKTGINADIRQFNPKGECESGGMYFFHYSQMFNCISYCKYIYYIRKVSFTPESLIYVEKGKFKTNEFILGERKKFDIQKFFKKYFKGKNSVQRCINENGMILGYIDGKNQTEEICKIAVQQHGLNLQFVKKQTDEICKIAVQNHGFSLVNVKNQTDEICRLAVKQNGCALRYVKNQTDEICKIAVQQNGCALGYVKNQTDEIRKLAAEKINR